MSEALERHLIYNNKKTVHKIQDSLNMPNFAFITPILIMTCMDLDIEE